MAKRISVDKTLFTITLLLVFVGLVMVLSEAKRARRRWREARRTWYEIEAVAIELRDERKELPLHNAPDIVTAIREGAMEQLKRERRGRPGSSSK